MKIFLMILVSFIFISNLKAQEVIGIQNGVIYQLPEYISANYNIVRTNQKGRVVWEIPYSKDFFYFDTTQGSYLIFGYTSIRNNVIFNNPSDYDYWLVANENINTTLLYPTLTTGIVYLYIRDVTELHYINIYNLNLQLLYNNVIVNNLSTLNITILPQGIYIYKIYNKSSTIKTGKIVKL